jgi:hypothetical protein
MYVSTHCDSIRYQKLFRKYSDETGTYKINFLSKGKVYLPLIEIIKVNAY